MLPTTIGKYEVAHLLGEGAMGEVYLARDPFIDRSVAVKLMKTSSAEDRERFQQEARTVGALSHPNIVVLHDFGLLAERPYLVMEFVPGRNLEDWLRDAHTLDEHLRIVEGLCRALLYAHGQGVLHRDLKPSNVQVMPDGECKLMDFGIARTGSGQLTTAHTVLGTPSYIAPEILEEAAYSPTGDVYSAGVVVYEMLAGINPFVGKSVASTLHNVLNRQPPHLIEQRPSLPSELCHAVMACLARDPGQRPRDLGRLLEVVRRARAAGPDEVGRTLSPQSQATASLRLLPLRAARRRRRRVALAAAALLGLGVVLTWSLTRDAAGPVALSTPSPPAPTPAATLAPPVEAPRQPAAAAAAPSPVSRAPSPAARPPAPLATPSPEAPAAMALASPPATPLPSAPPALVRAQPLPVPPASVVAAGAAPAQPAPAELRDLKPRRAGRGETVKLEIVGLGLRADHRVRVRRGQGEARGIVVVREQRLDEGLLRVTLLVDADVPPGLYSVLLVDAQARPTNSLSFEVTL